MGVRIAGVGAGTNAGVRARVGAASHVFQIAMPRFEGNTTAAVIVAATAGSAAAAAAAAAPATAIFFRAVIVAAGAAGVAVVAVAGVTAVAGVAAVVAVVAVAGFAGVAGTTAALWVENSAPSSAEPAIDLNVAPWRPRRWDAFAISAGANLNASGMNASGMQKKNANVHGM